MSSLPYIATYISYIFIVAVYAYKVAKVARLPMHLRWDLYPMPGHKAGLRGLLHKLKDYFILPGYFKRNKGYWLGLYPWHIGFYLIVSFHVLSFLGALLIITTHVSISAASTNFIGLVVYYLALICAAGSFILGSIGSVVLLVRRIFDSGLRKYATASNYFNYLFFLLVFISGLVAWIFADPTLSDYRTFWANLLTLNFAQVQPLAYTHILLFSLFLVYLPFTRSTHYITKLFAFFAVLWDDRPNLNGETFRPQLEKALEQPVDWSAAHISSAASWKEAVTRNLPEDKPGATK
jgi:nitrate reductase gamma subunit